MEPDACPVLRKDGRLQCPQPGAVRLDHLLPDQRLADTAAAVSLVDVDGALGDARIALAVRHRAQGRPADDHARSEEHTSELQSRENLVCRLLLEKKKRL